MAMGINIADRVEQEEKPQKINYGLFSMTPKKLDLYHNYLCSNPVEAVRHELDMINNAISNHSGELIGGYYFKNASYVVDHVAGEPQLHRVYVALTRWRKVPVYVYIEHINGADSKADVKGVFVNEKTRKKLVKFVLKMKEFV